MYLAMVTKAVKVPWVAVGWVAALVV